MYADEVHPHRTHQYTNLTMDVGAEKLQRPVHRLTRRGRREHRARMPEQRLHPAAYNSHKPRSIQLAQASTPKAASRQPSVNTSSSLTRLLATFSEKHELLEQALANINAELLTSENDKVMKRIEQKSSIAKKPDAFLF